MSLRSSGTQTGYFAVNTTSVDRIEVVEWDTSLDSSIEPVQSIGNGKALGIIEVPALSYARCPRTCFVPALLFLLMIAELVQECGT